MLFRSPIMESDHIQSGLSPWTTDTDDPGGTGDSKPPGRLSLSLGFFPSRTLPSPCVVIIVIIPVILLSLCHVTLTETQYPRSPSYNTTGRSEIHIAAILPEDNKWMFSLQKVLPALHQAIESPRVRQILPNHYFTIASADSQCNAIAAPLAGFNLHYTEKVTAFFGPVCDYSLAPTARYAPYWNATVLTAGGMAHDFGASKTSHNAEFPSLTRVGPTFDLLSQSMYDMMKYYSWNRVKVLYYPNGLNDTVVRFCYLAMSALIRHFREQRQDFHLFMFDDHQGDAGNAKMLNEEVNTKYSSEHPLRLMQCFLIGMESVTYPGPWSIESCKIICFLTRSACLHSSFGMIHQTSISCGKIWAVNNLFIKSCCHLWLVQI